MQIYNSKKDLWFMAWHLWDPVNRYVNEYKTRAETTNYYRNDVLEIRETFANKHCDITKAFDYGCGMRPFHYNFETNTSPCKGLWDKYIPGFTEFDLKSYLESETVMLFDVLEHMYDPHSFLTTLPQKKLIMTVPVINVDQLNTLDQIEGWKHTRPGEHFLYTNEKGIIDIVTECNWKIEHLGYDECPPREDIISLVLVRE